MQLWERSTICVLRCFLVAGPGEVLFSTDAGPLGSLTGFSSGDSKVTTEVGGRRVTFCVGHSTCVISGDRSKWESVGVVGDASLIAELEKVRIGDGFMDRVPEKSLMEVTGALSREAASCSVS